MLFRGELLRLERRGIGHAGKPRRGIKLNLSTIVLNVILEQWEKYCGRDIKKLKNI